MGVCHICYIFITRRPGSVSAGGVRRGLCGKNLEKTADGRKKSGLPEPDGRHYSVSLYGVPALACRRAGQERRLLFVHFKQ